MKNSIVLSFLTVVMVIGLMATPAQAEKPDTPGGPFQDLWSALNGAVASLQAQIDGIQEYLQQLTETDPIYSASPASGIQNTDITNWNAAYGWGDHSTAGYLTFIPSNVIEEGENVSLLTNDAGYLTSVELGVETAARIADVDTEEAARIAADNALESQIPRLGSFQGKSVGVRYYADTDGFVIAESSLSGTATVSVVIYRRIGNNYSSVAGLMQWGGSVASLTMPVPKGLYWDVVVASGSSSRVKWIPLGS